MKNRFQDDKRCNLSRDGCVWNKDPAFVICSISNESIWPGTETVDYCVLLKFFFFSSYGSDLVLEKKAETTQQQQNKQSQYQILTCPSLLFWELPLLDNECKRGRGAAKKMQQHAIPDSSLQGFGKGQMQMQIKFV